MKRKLSPFGQVISDRLYDLNMTQKNLAEEIGANEKYLSDIMRGRRAGHKYKKKLTEKLGLEEDYPISV